MDKNYFWLQEAIFGLYWFLVRKKLTLYLSSIALRVPQWKGGLNVVWKTEVRLNRTLIISWNDIGLKKETWKGYWEYLGPPTWSSSCTCRALPSSPLSTRPADSSSSEVKNVWRWNWFGLNWFSFKHFHVHVMHCMITDSLKESSLLNKSLFAANLQVHVHDSSIESCLSEERDFVARRSIVVPNRYTVI